MHVLTRHARSFIRYCTALKMALSMRAVRAMVASHAHAVANAFLPAAHTLLFVPAARYLPLDYGRGT